MAIIMPSSSPVPAFDIELETYNKDEGGIHPSNINQKPLTVVSGKDAFYHRASNSFATDLEAGETARLDAQQKGNNNNGGLPTILSKLGEFLLLYFRRVGRLACPGCACNPAE